VANRTRRRQLARMQLTREQLRAEQARRERRRRRVLAGVLTLVVVVVAGAIVGGTATYNHYHLTAAEKCAWVSSASAAKPVSKPAVRKPAGRTETVALTTTQGPVTLQLDGKAATCTVASFTHLARAGYFNDTPCHRLTTASIFVLQCGDPTGKGTGGPGYGFATENTPAAGSDGNAVYKAGTVAMANSGAANSNGSQFFLVYKDSPLPPNYTAFGTITQGMDTLQKVADAGVADGSGDGAPKLAVQLTTVTVS
jgi:peptidyl-prolyl cis-trans isomerase B (cyclophilin B)